MNETSYDVQVWSTDVYRGKRGNTHHVRWRVDRRPFKKPHKTAALAESFRAQLTTAARRGEAFDRTTGLPVSLLRAERRMSWFDFACAYVDMKWPRAAAKSRAGNADALATVTPALLDSARGKPADAVLRRALTGWAFNTHRRDRDAPDDVTAALRWVRTHTVDVSALADASTARRALEQLTTTLAGRQAAAKTVARKRAVLFNAMEYAAELKLLDVNPLPSVKWSAPKAVRAIDPRTVVNPEQARRLLAAVAKQGPSGPRLAAFFGCMYYAAMRPEEAAMVSRPDVRLPDGDGWGELLLSHTAPVAGAAWTDSGKRRDRRQLKQRGEGEVRSVPCPPPLVELLRDHLRRYGTAADGRLFRNLTGGELAESTTGRVWRGARLAVLGPDGAASPLARRPYDLRHAAVSTWLAAGVPSAQCAQWAGHSVGVLHQVYAKVLDGQESEARSRITAALGLHSGTAT